MATLYCEKRALHLAGRRKPKTKVIMLEAKRAPPRQPVPKEEDAKKEPVELAQEKRPGKEAAQMEVEERSFKPSGAVYWRKRASAYQ